MSSGSAGRSIEEEEMEVNTATAAEKGAPEKSMLNKETEKEKTKGAENQSRRIYEKEMTVVLDIDGGEVTAMSLIRAAKAACGDIMGCRMISADKYEVTVSTLQAKEKLLDGLRVGEARIHGKEITLDELVVSFMGLPVYIEDSEILDKLKAWGVTAVSKVRRRVWPGTDVADGTRYVKVKFTDTIKSLPYSARFITAAGPEFFRVLHDRQVKVCRGCLQPDHVYRDCPEFLCRICGNQGHYARECTEYRSHSHNKDTFNKRVQGEGDKNACEGLGEEGSGSGDSEQEENSVYQHLFSEVTEGTSKTQRCIEAPVQERGRETASRLTPSQGGGAKQSSTPKAAAAGVEPGKGGDSGPAPRSTPGRGGAAPEGSRIPRSSRSKSLELREKAVKRNEYNDMEGTEVGKTPGEKHPEVHLEQSNVRITHTSKSQIPTPVRIRPAPPAAESTRETEAEQVPMDSQTAEQKKRQFENEGGKKATKKHK